MAAELLTWSEKKLWLVVMSVDVRLPQKRKRVAEFSGSEAKHVVSPGDVITEDTGYMR